RQRRGTKRQNVEPLFDAVDTVRNCLAIFTEMLAHTTFNSDRMREAAGGGFSTATDVAEYLVEQGVPFRRAHEIVGRIVAHCIKSKKTFADLGLKDYQKFHAGFKEDLMPRIKLENSVNARRHRGGTATSAVKERIREFEKKFGKK
ncbi:MAG: argininosuccinate lyase, partial [Deltaproteobacteria bacterium HGW-Deltaproteobacteria-9]